METASAIGCDLAAEVAVKFGRVCIRAWGTSMLPAVHPGDLIWLQRVVPTEVRVGEIVAFTREGRLIVHRVAAVGGSRPGEVGDEEFWLITRGDRLQREDAPIFGAELIGRVTHIERDGVKVPAPLQLSRMQRALGPLLRISDRATGLYVRLVAL